jgi:thioredoxin reductase (NADPH)
VVHRRDQLRATAIMQEKAFSNPKINFIWNTVVEGIEGDGTVKRARLHNLKTGEKSVLEVAGIFVSTGQKPNSGFLKGALALDKTGKIITDDMMQTSVSGVFAAGDIRANSGMQAVIAAGEGAAAAVNARKYLTEE